jgi:biopolymer transport protein ExbD
LISLRTDDPDLNVIVRGDALTHYKGIRGILDICQKANLPKVDLATEISK